MLGEWLGSLARVVAEVLEISLRSQSFLGWALLVSVFAVKLAASVAVAADDSEPESEQHMMILVVSVWNESD